MRRSPAKTYVDYISGPVKIKDGLYMGDEVAARDMDFIASNKVTHIINTVVNRIPNLYQRLGVQYLSVNWTERQQNIFDKKNNSVNMIYDFVQQAMEQGESVLVHSINGKSRAGSVVIAYLMKKYQWSLQKSIDFILSKKTAFKIRNSYLAQLEDFQKRMAQHYNLTSSWSQSKNDEQLIMNNTFKNSKISKQQSKNENRKGGKKVSWGDKVIIGSNMKTPNQSILTSVSKYKQFLEHEGIKPLKSILKGDNEQLTKKQQAEDIENFQLSHQSYQLRPNSRQNKGNQEKMLGKSQVIGNIRGNVINVVVNNFLTNQKSNTRYSSIPNRQRQTKKLESRSGSRLAPYQNIISSIKSPYDTNFINRIGQNPKNRKKQQKHYIKQPNTQQRPHSVNLQQSQRHHQGKPTSSKISHFKQDMNAMNGTAKGRYPWSNPRENPIRYK